MIHERFNLSLNVRDFIEVIGNATEGSELFAKIQMLLPTHTFKTEYVVYDKGFFKLKSRALVHIKLFDIMNRRDELISQSEVDRRVNLDIWDTARLVAKHALTEEFRAYKKEKKECLKV